MEETTKNVWAEDLNIVWGNDNRYWQMVTIGERQVAELKQVCWLEVRGACTIEKPITKGKRYAISFEMELTGEAFGWNGCNVYIMAKIGKKGKYKWQRFILSSELKLNEKSEIPNDKSLCVEVPSDAVDDPVIYFGLYEVWTGRWKGGLKIYRATVKEI